MATTVEHAGAAVLEASPSPARRIVLLGNPNVGKSALFNALTGLRATVSNYPGTTVEVYRGRLGGNDVEVIDSPGTNSLMPMSEDEQVTSDLVRSVRGEEGAVVVQVADAKNLRRALLLTLQLGQLEVPTVLVLNMHDEAEARGIKVDLLGLEAALGVPVRTTVATRGLGVEGVLRALARRARAAQPHARCRGRGLSRAGSAHGRRGACPAARPPSSRATTSRCWSTPGRSRAPTPARAGRTGRPRLAPPRPRGRPPGVGLADPRRRPVGALRVRGRLRRRHARRPRGGRALPRLPEPVGDRLFSTSRGPSRATCSSGEYGLMTMGLSYGLAIVLPIVATFFTAFALLEDSGYLPRLAVMSDRVFRLHGAQRQGRPPDGPRPRLRHHGHPHHPHPAPRRRSACSRRCSSRSACPARPSSASSSPCWPPCPSPRPRSGSRRCCRRHGHRRLARRAPPARRARATS